MTNDPGSALGSEADIVFDIAAGAEATVSTKTYTNTLAVGCLLGHVLNGRCTEGLVDQTADHVEAYLARWPDHLGTLRTLVGLPERLYLVGRGASLAAAECGR